MKTLAEFSKQNREKWRQFELASDLQLKNIKCCSDSNNGLLNCECIRGNTLNIKLIDLKHFYMYFASLSLNIE